MATWESFGSEGDQGLDRMTEETLKDAGQKPPDQSREDGKPWSSFESDGDQSLILTMDRSMLEFDKRKQENKSKDDWLSGIQKYPLEEDIKNEMSREGIKEPSTETTESSSPPLPTPTVSPGVLGVGGENVPDRAIPPLSPPILGREGLPTDGRQPMAAKNIMPNYISLICDGCFETKTSPDQTKPSQSGLCVEISSSTPQNKHHCSQEQRSKDSKTPAPLSQSRAKLKPAPSITSFFRKLPAVQDDKETDRKRMDIKLAPEFDNSKLLLY